MGNSKQRLFEVMGKIDNSFKSEINEDYNNREEFSTNNHLNFRDRERNAGVEKDNTPRKDIEYVKMKNGGYLRADMYKPYLGDRADNKFYIKKDGVYVMKESTINEMPKFGGQNVSQDTYDELQYDMSNMADAMANAFKTPPNYQMKNKATVGSTIELSDGDKVQVKGIDANTGNINVRVFHSADSLEKYKKWGVPIKKPYFDITWSPVQFDSIVGTQNPMNEMGRPMKVNRKYTHFAVIKDTGKIVNGWEYKGYDPAELRSEKKYYFFNDIQDMQINPKIINVVTAKHLQKQGIDPFDFKNWHKNDVDGTDIFTL